MTVPGAAGRARYPAGMIHCPARRALLTSCLLAGLTACPDPGDGGPRPPGDSAASEPGDTATAPDDSQPPLDSGDSDAPAPSCEISLSIDGAREALLWSVEASAELHDLQLELSWYDGMVTRTVRHSDSSGSLGLLPHRVEGHSLQQGDEVSFEVQVSASTGDGGSCSLEQRFPFLEIQQPIAAIFPPGLRLDEQAISSELDEALEDLILLRSVAMQDQQSDYVHFVVAQDVLGTPLRVYSIPKAMVDAVTSEPLGYAMLAGADAHDGRLYVMIDSFPGFEVGATLILDPQSGALTGFLPTPAEQVLNHRLSVRAGDGEQVVMDTLAWKKTDTCEANQAVEASFVPGSSEIPIDSVEAWYDPSEELALRGQLYCNATAASPSWQVVTCPNTNRDPATPPETELIAAFERDSHERMLFLRQGYTGEVLASGWEQRWDTVISLPDHPVHDEPLLSLVHDAVIQGGRLAVLSLQIDSTTDQNTSVYLLDFDRDTGSASFHCGYENSFMVRNYGNLVQPEGSPLLGLHLPNSGGFRWIDGDCQELGALEAREGWDQGFPGVLHQRWLEPSTGADLGHADSSFSYHLRAVELPSEDQVHGRPHLSSARTPPIWR
jgi:hypothetical protein